MQLWTASGFTSIFVRHLWDSSGSHVTLWCAEKKKMSKMSSVFFSLPHSPFGHFDCFRICSFGFPVLEILFFALIVHPLEVSFFFPFRDFFWCFILYSIIFLFSYSVIRLPQVYHFLLTFFSRNFLIPFFFVDIFIPNICLINATCSSILFAFHLFSIFLLF